MKIYHLAFMFFILTSQISIAKPDKIINKGMLFTEARQKLISSKWMPDIVHLDSKYEYVGVEKELIRRNFKEVDYCSIDTSNCILRYKKNKKCLQLETVGEHVSFMKVVRWSEECRDSPPKPASASGKK